MVVLALVLAGCAKTAGDIYENQVYFSRKSETTVRRLSIAMLDNFHETLSAAMPIRSDEDVVIEVAPDESLVDEFNLKYGENSVMLPESFYKFSTSEIVIPAGSVASPEFSIDFGHILDLSQDTTYVLPVVIKNASIPVLKSRSVKYYYFQSSGIINTAPWLDGEIVNMQTLVNGNYITITWSDPKQVEDWTAFTYEAFAYVEYSTDGLPTRGQNQGGTNFRTTDNMYSLMGHENGILVRRWGNLNNSKWKMPNGEVWPLEIKNLKSATDSREGINCPDFPDRKWTVFALTYDKADGMVRLYFDQTLVHEEKIGNCELSFHDSQGLFYLGRSKGEIRWWPGFITEARVWNRALSEEELKNPLHPFYLDMSDPKSHEGLVGYWKCNEGTGDIINDYSGYGNHGKSNRPIEWRTVKQPEYKIEIPR